MSFKYPATSAPENGTLLLTLINYLPADEHELAQKVGQMVEKGESLSPVMRKWFTFLLEKAIKLKHASKPGITLVKVYGGADSEKTLSWFTLDQAAPVPGAYYYVLVGKVMFSKLIKAGIKKGDWFKLEGITMMLVDYPAYPAPITGAFVNSIAVRIGSIATLMAMPSLTYKGLYTVLPGVYPMFAEVDDPEMVKAVLGNPEDDDGGEEVTDPVIEIEIGEKAPLSPVPPLREEDILF